MKIRADTWRYFCVIPCFLCATLRQKNITLRVRFVIKICSYVLLSKTICGANSVKFSAFCVQHFFHKNIKFCALLCRLRDKYVLMFFCQEYLRSKFCEILCCVQ